MSTLPRPLVASVIRPQTGGVGPVLTALLLVAAGAGAALAAVLARAPDRDSRGEPAPGRDDEAPPPSRPRP